MNDVSEISADKCTISVKTFTDTSASTFEYDSLVLGTYYLLKETNAPSGYLLGSKPWYAVIATSAATPATITALSKDSAVQRRVGDPTDGGTYPIYNRKAATATWNKVDGTGAALEGAEWTLTQYANETASKTPSSALRVYTITYTKPSGTATQGSYTMTCTTGTSTSLCAENGGSLSMTEPTDKPGVTALSYFMVSGLPWGYYVLTETKAPSGHSIDGTIPGQAVGGDTAKFAIEYGTVKNQNSITALPLTGGTWTPRRVLVLGAILFTLSGAAYAVARRSGWRNGWRKSGRR